MPDAKRGHGEAARATATQSKRARHVTAPCQVMAEVVVQLLGVSTLALGVWGWARPEPAPCAGLASMALLGGAATAMCLPARTIAGIVVRVTAAALALASAVLWAMR